MVFPNLQLGGAREMMEAVQMGNLEMLESGSAMLSVFTDKFKFASLPYLFPTREVAFDFFDSEMAQELTDRIAEETDLRILGFYENGYYSATNSKRAIRSPEDMKGLKLRVQENDIYLQTYTALGANPLPMSFSEAYTAIQQGTIDGQQSNYVLTHTSMFYELLTHFTDNNFFYDITGIYINQDFFDGLSPEHQQILIDCGKESATHQRDLALKAQEDAIAFLGGEGGMELTYLTDDERQVFVDATMPVYDWFRQAVNEPNLDMYLDEIARLSN